MIKMLFKKKNIKMENKGENSEKNLKNSAGNSKKN